MNSSLRRSPTARVALGLMALIVSALGLAASLTVGPGDFGLDAIRLVFAEPGAGPAHAILWQLRLPRSLLALGVGASLGAAGALSQGLFRNPLASPAVLGIPTGAATAVVAGFALGLDGSRLWVTPLLAFVGALAVLLLLFGIAGRGGTSTTLLLTGVAVGALGGAITTCLLAFNIEQWDLPRRAMAWMMGSFDGRGWAHLRWASPPILLGLVLALGLHRGLDLLMLGEESARSLGVELERFRFATAAAIAVLVGAATAAVGAIVFVGLVVPHLARALVGPRHFELVPASALLGAWMVLAIDTIGRAFSPIFLPPGALSSLVGSTFFLVLLARSVRLDEGGQR